MRSIRKRILVIVGLLVGIGGGYLAYNRFLAPEEAVEEALLQTSVVRRGDIIISVGGSGTVYPTDEIDLSLNSSGTLVEVLVEVGDRIEAGDLAAPED